MARGRAFVRVLVVAVIVDVIVIGAVIVAVHVHVNDTVGVIAPLDHQGSIILVSMATTRSSSSTSRDRVVLRLVGAGGLAGSFGNVLWDRL